MVTVVFKGKKDYSVEIPENWDELSPANFAYLLKLQLLQVSGDEIKTALLWKLCKKTVPRRQFWDMAENQASNLLSLLAWTDEAPYSVLSKFPVITIGPLCRFGIGKKIYGPGDNISGVSIDQVAIAEISMNSYSVDFNTDDLNTMVAALYYPGATINGVDDKILSALKAKIARVPFVTRFTVLVAYRAIRATFPDLWKDLFNGPAAPVDIDDVTLWNNLFSGLAKDGPKDIEANRKTEAFSVFNWLNKNAQEMKKK